MVLTCLLLAQGFAALAQTGGGSLSCGEEREVRPGQLGESTFNRLNEAQEMLAAEDNDGARAVLDRLAGSRISDYELAVVEQYLGHLEIQREQYRLAIEHFGDAVKLDQLPNETHFEVILQIAQLHNAIEQYDQALEQLDFWFCIADEDARKQADVWVLKASLHAQRGEWQKVLDSIDRALGTGQEPAESWYRLKLGALQQLNKYRQAIDVLKTLVRLNPDGKNYWLQLSGTYQELEEYDKAMGALRLGYRRGLLDQEVEFMRLAGLLQQMQAPRQAAEVLEQGLATDVVESTASNWEIVAGAWFQARELSKARNAYARAARLSDHGRLDYARAQLLVSAEHWQAAIAAATEALKKGGLDQSQTGNSHLLIGVAHFNQKNFEQAKQAFQRAANYGTLRSAAEEWLNHIAQKIRQQAIR